MAVELNQSNGDVSYEERTQGSFDRENTRFLPSRDRCRVVSIKNVTQRQRVCLNHSLESI